MRHARAIAWREFASYFRAPAGWIAIALFLFLVGVCYAVWALVPGHPASMRSVFVIAGWVFLPVVPAISMRVIAEELRAGTYESLCTSPAGPVSVVLGKFAGAGAFLVLMMAPTGAHVALLCAHALPAPDAGPIIAGYLCLALMGMLYLSIGVAASSLTSNATLAFMVTFFALLSLLLAPGFAESDWLPAWARRTVLALAPEPRITDFARGVIGLTNVTYFVTGTGLFLLIAVAVMELRRWR